MVTLSTATQALKDFYLGVLADQLNVGVNPLLAKIGKTGADVWGKDIIKLAPYGVNGGIGSGSETDDLPTSGSNKYAQFNLSLKNLFGRIEISDKAMRASENSAGAFVNLLNAEMEGLLKASKFNFGRMLYGDGSGLLATTVTNAGSANSVVTVDDARCLMEGMKVDVYNSSDVKDTTLSGARIEYIDRATKNVTLSVTPGSAYGAGYKLYVQGSKNNELTGLEAIFGASSSIYGLTRADYPFLTPYTKTVTDGVTSENIQDAIDYIERNAGGQPDFIVCSYDVRKEYIANMAATRTNVDYMNIDNGFKALSYNGIPLVVDRFVKENTMYVLNSADFKLHQLCDWRWLEGEGGTVLHQIAGKASYSATLVKYADLLCERPMAQAKITFNTSSAPDYYTVNFNSNGGTAVAKQLVVPGGHAITPTAPTKSGKTFGGWFYNGTQYAFATSAVNANITLDASWS